MEPFERLIIALDVGDRFAAAGLAERLEGCAGLMKVGLRLFTAEGPEVVRMLRERGAGVFLDLKLHDIPNTAGQAAEAAAGLGVRMMTAHLCGGPEMVRAARRALGDQGPEAVAGGAPLLLGVTVLTSMSEETLRSAGVARGVEEQVLRLAELGFEEGVRGFVASPREIGLLRRRFGGEITIVTPGVRPEWAGKDDQRRVMTPREAVEAGADFLVIGRPVTGAADPREAARRIALEIAGKA